jgi:thioredoxin 1
MPFMKKLRLFTKIKELFPFFMVAFTLLFVLMLFVFKDKLNQMASIAVKAQAGAEITSTASAFIDSAYNYFQNGLSYEYTFLEFGATGCAPCKRMEMEMAEIRIKYPDKVNVVFLNILKPESQMLMKYYGVAAIPAQVLLNGEGQEVFRHTGFYSTNDLIKQFQNK